MSTPVEWMAFLLCLEGTILKFWLADKVYPLRVFTVFFSLSKKKNMSGYSTSNETTTVCFYALSISLTNVPFSAIHYQPEKESINKP
jgi:hypothetical protein